MNIVLIVAASYLLGSIPTAVWLGKWSCKTDIREHGSGNAGATNALRVLGLKWGLIIMVLDILKGLAAVLLLAPLLTFGRPSDPQLLSVLAGAAAIMGHIFPATIGFRGGKGVGTGAGVMFALAPLVALTALIIWVIVVTATRYVSLGSMLAALSLTPLLFLQGALFDAPPGGALLIFAVLLTIGVLVSHRANIGRLLERRENRLSLRKPRMKGETR